MRPRVAAAAGAVLLLFAAALPAGAQGAPPPAAEAAIRAAIRDFVVEQSGVPGAEAFVGIVRANDPSAPDGGAFEIVRVGSDGTVRSGRSVPFELFVRGSGPTVREIRATADVSLFVPVVVSVRDIPAGGVVGPEDVVVRKREYTQATASLLLRDTDAVGRKARWRIVAGVPLRKDYLEDTAALRRGDPVLLVAESGRVRITGRGVALQGGRVGDVVLVRNLASGKETHGRLAEGRVVRMD